MLQVLEATIVCNEYDNTFSPMLIKLHLPISLLIRKPHALCITHCSHPAEWEKNDKHIQYPKLFITKLRMAFLPSFQQSFKRSNHNRTTLLHTCEKKGDTRVACLGNKYLTSKSSRANEEYDKLDGLSTKTAL